MNVYGHLWPHQRPTKIVELQALDLKGTGMVTIPELEVGQQKGWFCGGSVVKTH